jgi:ATP-dependent helicase/nuclease subunit A
MPGDVFGPDRWRLPASGDLLGRLVTQLQLEFDRAPGPGFTSEQAVAIERRDGDLLLDAGAGSGKTTVLVERFARSVIDDGIDVGRIVTITFTEKAASEMRERIRGRLRELGDDESARATEGAWISTIHGFCARVVRAYALTAGLDPEFVVLDPVDAGQLSRSAFDAALSEVARTEAGANLIATYAPARLRVAIASTYAELRSRGLPRPSLPACPQAAGSGIDELELVRRSASAALRELGQVDEPGTRVREAIELLEGVEGALASGIPWPGQFDSLKLGNAANHLKTEACDRFREAVTGLRKIAETVHSLEIRDSLDALLQGYGERYAALKLERSGLDFDDLEMYARQLLSSDSIGERYRERFERVMVDEMQDTNRVQLDLIELVSEGNLFTVGDAQQSIYGFRHADVELFEARGRALEAVGARASLRTNFRSRRQILDVLNAAFSSELGDAFRPLVPGRDDPPAADALVELLIVDRLGDYEDEGAIAPWRRAEARVLADRVRRLLDSGEATAGDVVVLTRATTDLAAYERALEEAGVPTYVIGGRGYWAHPQVVELLSYLRALANPLDEEAWYTTLLSPLCGLSLDGLVLTAAGAREELDAEDSRRLSNFEQWFAGERAAFARTGAEELIDRALAHRGYEQLIAARPDARRRFANVRKLMRFAREWEAGHGTDLPGFVALLGVRTEGEGGKESEAPVESEALDAVRLMTIHRSKGLEFPVVCVADLGRLSSARGPAPLIRVGRDGCRLGLRIGRPGTAPLVEALDYAALKAEQNAAEAAEERRLFYVALTRAKERVILSGAAQLFDFEMKNRNAPIGWIASALVPEIGSRIAEGAFTTDAGVRVSFTSESPASPVAPAGPTTPAGAPTPRQPATPSPLPPDLLRSRSSDGETREPAGVEPLGPPVTKLSYTAITDYDRCAYRFYVEHVLRLPTGSNPAVPLGTGGHSPPVALALTGAAKGTFVHDVLRDLDFRRPVQAALPEGTPPDVTGLLTGFAASATSARLAAAANLRREQPFLFRFDQFLIAGVFDALIEDAGRLVVVDYKTDRVPDGFDPQAITDARYGTQRSIYGLAALKTGAAQVEVVHLFLERPDEPATSWFTAAAIPDLEAQLETRVAGLRAGDFPVTASPGRSVCDGCPAAGGLCSYPPEITGG